MRILPIIILFIGLSASAQTNLGAIHLAWDYPSNELVGVDASFIIRSSADITVPVTNWPVIYNDSWTNTIITNFDGTNYTFTIGYLVQPIEKRFYIATASNFWGESFFSNTSSTPAIAKSTKLKIKKDN